MRGYMGWLAPCTMAGFTHTYLCSVRLMITQLTDKKDTPQAGPNLYIFFQGRQNTGYSYEIQKELPSRKNHPVHLLAGNVNSALKFQGQPSET